MKSALAEDLIARHIPDRSSVSLNAVRRLLSVPEYGLDCLSKRFLEAAVATLRLMRFRAGCVNESSKNDVLPFVKGALDVTIEDILAGEIIISVEEQLEPTEDCPEGNKGEYILGKDGKKDTIKVRRSVFESKDEGTLTLAHEAIHANYDHDGTNRRTNTLDLVPALTPTMEQAIASAITMAAFTLLYGDDLLELRRALRDQICSDCDRTKAELADKLAEARRTSRDKPILYIHYYVLDKLIQGQQSLAKKDDEVYGAELILTHGGLFSDEALPELMYNAAMNEAAKRTNAIYGQVMELENQILKDAESACQCGLDSEDDPELRHIYPAKGGYVNHGVFFALARKRAKGHENAAALNWWFDRQTTAVARLKEGNVAGANAALDQTIATQVEAETHREMGVEPGKFGK